MPNLNISVSVRRPLGLNTQRALDNPERYLLEAFQKAVSGKNQSDGVIWSYQDDNTVNDYAYAGQAIAALAISGGAGSVGGTIGGVANNVTWATSDTATATALAAFIRANVNSNRKVTATNIAARLTLASVAAGQFIDIHGVRFTARNGTPVAFGDFDMSGTDTQDAASLCLAINRHPSTSMRYRAVNAAGLVYIFTTTARNFVTPSQKWEGIVNAGNFSTFTLTQQTPAVGAVVAVLAAVPGDIGNEVRAVASGTGVTALTNGTAGFLGHGTGGGRDIQFVLP